MKIVSSLSRRGIGFIKQLPIAYRAVLPIISFSLLILLVYPGEESRATIVSGKGLAAGEPVIEGDRVVIPLELPEPEDDGILVDTPIDGAAAADVRADEKADVKGDAAADESRMWAYEIQSGDTLTGVFQKLNLPLSDLYQVLEADEAVLALDNIKPGVKLLIDVDNEQLQALELKFSPAHKVTYKRKQDAGFEFAETRLPGEWKQYAITGEIGRSFSVDAEAQGLDVRDAYQITRLLKEKINFSRDIRKGDSFEVLVSRQFIDDEPTGETQVEAVRLMANRSPVAIFYYDGTYYDEKGRSLSKAFMRYPFNGKHRVSSNFNPNRHHPVTGLSRPHNGTDFAMRTGTGILAAGDGVVTRVVNHKYAGLYVEVKHSERYTTRYLHLSKALVHKGQRVSRGQKIALSGSSGRVTGPHLHYEFRIAGRPVNAMTAEIPIAKHLEGKSRKEFDSLLGQYLTRMDEARPADGVMVSQRSENTNKSARSL
ncbi:peptidoglycan DD-metalloendopeptidase family protein [Marinobacterium lutimaris]|uniref:Murein DD-endopeptidase MepM and murein hydrolase activator NlpD, contain LysM domain n=1 Tax=Marinobacterium lutimaris TaxID=568106 RepID=A0A1H5ZDC0_9GAMM|nr:peptidoglycan DD-metalloendopeptidase family protein [Marinobacterium lutimaris]SEG34398.1 Murein DD-endopeptidase MepM and murein hydrolase activator NlpD, contain LysM domain [Marinobacterium lutimaris]